MDKKLYWTISNGDTSYTMTLGGCLELIKSETGGLDEFDLEDVEYTLAPVWMTDEEFDNMPEAE